MIGFVTTKKRISTVLLGVLLSIILICLVIYKCLSISAVTDNLQSAKYSIERVAFIENMGYKVNADEPEQSRQIEIPNVFSDIYEEYQQLQLSAGYDLKSFAGKEATLYTYKLIYENRTDVYAHLLCVDEKIIGGDISALSVTDGFINPLAPMS